MQVNTKLFGNIEIDEEKIICFESGIIGFPHCRQFTLVFEENEEGKQKNICWLQSLDEPAFAMPVIDPLLIMRDYNPKVEHELLKGLGKLTEENTYVLVSVTVPKDIEQISANLKAPIVINTDNRKAEQLIVEENLPVKYMIYDIICAGNKKDGE